MNTSLSFWAAVGGLFLGAAAPAAVPQTTYDFETPQFTVPEDVGPGGASILVFRVGDLSSPGSVDYQLLPVTADPGVDYQPVSGTLTFAPQQPEALITVPILDDLMPEETEIVHLELLNPVGGVLGEQSVAELLILDNDGPPSPQAELEIVKVALPDETTAGSPINFEVWLTNFGPDPTANVIVQDHWPAELQLIGSDAPPGTTFDPNQGTWSLPALGVGETVMLSLTFTRTTAGVSTNTVSIVSSDTPDPVPENNRAEASGRWVSTVTEFNFATAVFSEVESAGAAGAAIRVTRTGNLDTEQRVDYLVSPGTASPGVDFVPDSGTLIFPPGQGEAVFHVALIDDLEPEDTESVHLELRNPVGGVLGPQAVAELLILDDDGPRIPQADLEIIKVARPEETAVGSPITFEIWLTNFGPDPATNVIVQDHWPPELQLVSSNVPPETVFDAAQGTWSLPNLPFGGVATLSLSFTRATAGISTNTVSIVSSDTPDPRQENHTAQATGRWGTTAAEFSFALDTYTAPENLGPAGAEIRVVRTGDLSQPGSVDYSTSPGSATAGEDYQPVSGTLDFAPGQAEASFVVPIVDDAIEELPEESVHLTLGNPIGGTLGLLSEAELLILDDDTNVTPATADLQLSKSVLLADPLAGQRQTFRLALFNAGPDDARNIVVRDDWPADLQFIDVVAPPGTTFDPTKRTWTLPLLRLGTGAFVDLSFTRLNGGTSTNVAVIVSADVPDPNAADNTASASAKWKAAADLELRVTAHTNEVRLGEEIGFSIVITNRGPDKAENVSVRFPVPEGTDLVLSVPSPDSTYDPNNGLWNMATLAARQSDELLVFVRAMRVGQVTATGEIHSSSLPDPDSTPNNGAEDEDDQRTLTLNVLPGFRLSGVIRDCRTNGPPLTNVLVTLSGRDGFAFERTARTDANGAFVFTNLPVATYSVTPSLPLYTFIPASAVVVVKDRDLATNFVGRSFSIRAWVREGATNGPPMAGIPIRLSGQAEALAVTDTNGWVTFTNLVPGQFVLTPQTNGVIFAPTNLTVTLDPRSNCTASASFIATNRRVVLRAIEVTQAIQDWRNTVPLVRDKATVVRVHLQLPDNARQPLLIQNARLRGFRNGAELQNLVGGLGLTPLNPHGRLLVRTNDVSGEAVRTNFAASLNFRLPDFWPRDELELRFEWTNGLVLHQDPAEPGGAPNDGKVRLKFTKVPRVEVAFVPVNWVTNKTTNAPSKAQIQELMNRLDGIFPMFERNYVTQPPLTWKEPEPSGKTLPKLLTILNAKRAADTRCRTNKCLYYGVLDLPTRVGGEARNIPGNVACGSLPSAPSLYGRNRHAHELGHLLGQHHATDKGLFGFWTDSATGKVNTNGVSGACRECASTAAPPFPFFANVGGVMFARLGLMGAGPDPALNHIYGLDTFNLNPADPRRVHVISPFRTAELMSYCNKPHWRWISKYTYTNVMAALIKRFTPPAPAPPLLQLQFAQPAPSPTGYLLVRGTIDLASGGLTFLPFQFVSPPEPLGDPPGAYTLLMLDADGDVLHETTFEPGVIQADAPEFGDDQGPPTTAAFLVPVPYSPDYRAAVIAYEGEVVGQVIASGNPPMVTVLGPNGGEVIGGDPIQVQWMGQDIDGDALTYLVQYSPDDGQTWLPLGVDEDADRIELPTDFIPAGAAARIRVVASDGFLVAVDESDRPFQVLNHPPRLEVRSPLPDTAFTADQSILFQAEADDVEDGLLENVMWTSDLDGLLGEGRTLGFAASDLSEGRHQIEVAVTDSTGATTTAELTILVQRQPQPRLRIKQSAGQVQIAWEAELPEFVLEQTDSLTAPQWQPVLQSPTLTDDQWQTILPVTDRTRFFRLRAP